VTPYTVPGAPTGVSAVPGNAQATLSWAAPANTGGNAITGYTVTASGGGSCTAVAPATTCVVTGLTNGTAYTFTVVATNAAGNSVASAPSASVTPATVPGAPTGATATAGNAQASVAWTAPASDGGSTITGYTVTAIGGSGGACSAVAPATICTVTGLANGTAYTFTVTATNAAGTSAPSAPSASVTPFTVPDAPTGVTATAGNGQATVSWAAPASNGSPITGYTVTASNGATCTATPPATSCVVTGLTNGTAYTFTVVAANAAGASAPSAPSASVTPATVPGAPTGVSGVPGNAQVTVSWAAPASTGGSAITGYTVTASNGATCATSGTSCVVTGLANGTAYTFTVKATNGAGNSAASAPSASVTPFTVPDAPTNVTATAGAGQAVVGWTAPANNGGSAITRYTVTAIPGAAPQSAGLALQAAPAGGSCTAIPPATSCTVTGLTQGVPYTFTVVATNAAGDSVASVQSNSVTPYALAVQPVPTLSQWALALLALLMAGVVGGMGLRQRRATA
jgi:invasion protein IalB